MVPDLPPFGPRHFHVVVFHPGPAHRLGVYQLYFPDDPAREFDWRATFTGDPEMLRSTDERLTLAISLTGEASFDLF